MAHLGYPLIGYLAVLSVLTAAVAGYDKWAASHRPRHRVRERTLWWLAWLGGSAALWLTMQFIRHKTRHRSFQIGLPILFFLQCLLVGGVLFYFFKGETLWLLS